MKGFFTTSSFANGFGENFQINYEEAISDEDVRCVSIICLYLWKDSYSCQLIWLEIKVCAFHSIGVVVVVCTCFPIWFSGQSFVSSWQNILIWFYRNCSWSQHTFFKIRLWPVYDLGPLD